MARRNPVGMPRPRARIARGLQRAEGFSEALMGAHGFAISDMVELVHAGLATVTAEGVVTGGTAMEIAWVKITDTGTLTWGKSRAVLCHHATFAP